MQRRISLAIWKKILFACGLTAAMNAAAAFPEQDIRIILGNAPGSMVDTVGRKLAEKMSEKLKTNVFIQNVPGAAGTIGADQLVRAKPDGYTVGMFSSNYAINPALYPLNFNAAKDLTPISVLGVAPMVLVVNSSLPVHNLQELLEHIRKNPGQVSFGSTGQGSVGHLCVLMMQSQADVKVLHVPYKGNDRYAVDLAGGQIDAGFLTLAPAMPLIDSGRLRAIAVSTPERFVKTPDFPTMAEGGLKEFNVDAWVAMMAPSGVSPDVIKQILEASNWALEQPDMREYLLEQGVVVTATDDDEAAKIIHSDIEKYKSLLKSANLDN
jgi:tripartite-type tricarboxylate transporter receptor subunit TctC